MTHNDILQAFQQLSFEEKQRAISAIEAEWEGRQGLISELGLQLEQSRIGPMPCPHCNSSHTIHRGASKGVEQFTCKDCKRHFRGSYGTALFRIRRKDKWQAYLRLMEQGYSIKRAAKELGIAVQTSFNWRHKILASLQSTLPVKIGGVVECDDFSLTQSSKGLRKLERKPRKRGSDGHKQGSDKISVVTAVSRSKGTITAVVAARKISGKEAVKALEGRLEPKAVLITDENGAYNAVSRKNKQIIHKKVNSKLNQTQKPKDKLHLQTVNNQHKQIRDFLAPFNGVATKYLPNYLNWFVYRQSQNGNREKLKEMLITCLSATTALTWLLKLIQ
jgi:transposase-like protein/IS1 family transposase